MNTKNFKGVSLGWVEWDEQGQEWGGGIWRNAVCSKFLHKNLSFWVVLSEFGIYYSKSEYLNPKVYKI